MLPPLVFRCRSPCLVVAVQIIPAVLILSMYIAMYGGSPWTMTVDRTESIVRAVAARPMTPFSCDVVIAAPGDGRFVVINIPSCPKRAASIKVCYIDTTNIVDVDCDAVGWLAFIGNFCHIALFLFVFYESTFTCAIVTAMAYEKFNLVYQSLHQGSSKDEAMNKMDMENKLPL